MEKEFCERFVIVTIVNHQTKRLTLTNFEISSSQFESEPTKDNILKEMKRLELLGYEVKYSKVEKRYLFL